MSRGSFTSGLVATALVLTSTSIPAAAQDLGNYEGSRATTVQDDLRGRGYRTAGSKNGFALWKKDNRCLGITVRSDMVTDAQWFQAKDCGGGGDDAGAVIAGVAVAAILGAALLGHHDKHYEDGYRPTNNAATANFERGYQDGLHDGPFYSSGNNSDYNQGYNAGQQERTNRLHANRDSWDGGGGKAAARAACTRYAQDQWGTSAHATNTRSTGDGFAVDVSSGYESATCIYQNGRVASLG